MSFAIVYNTHQPSHAAGYIGLVSIHLPGLRQEVFAEFGDGVLVGHTRNVIADHALPSFPLHQAWRGIFPAETRCDLCRIRRAAGSLP